MTAAEDLAREMELYDSRRAEFEKNHNHEWVVIHGEDVTFFEDFQDAAQSAVERFGRGPYLIRQVGSPERVPMPSSLLYHPIYADS